MTRHGRGAPCVWPPRPAAGKLTIRPVRTASSPTSPSARARTLAPLLYRMCELSLSCSRACSSNICGDTVQIKLQSHSATQYVIGTYVHARGDADCRQRQRHVAHCSAARPHLPRHWGPRQQPVRQRQCPRGCPGASPEEAERSGAAVVLTEGMRGARLGRITGRAASSRAAGSAFMGCCGSRGKQGNTFGSRREHAHTQALV